MPDADAALFYINDLAQVGGAAAGTTGPATELSARYGTCLVRPSSLPPLRACLGAGRVIEHGPWYSLLVRMSAGLPCSAGAHDMPGVPVDAFKAKVSAVHVVAKGRQGVDAANSVQVRTLSLKRCPLHVPIALR